MKLYNILTTGSAGYTGNHTCKTLVAAVLAAAIVIFAACESETDPDDAGQNTVSIGESVYRMQGYTYIESTKSGVLYSEGVQKTKVQNSNGYTMQTSIDTGGGYTEAWAIDFVKPEFTVTEEQDDSNRFWHFTLDKSDKTEKKRYFMMPGTTITGSVSETAIALQINGTIQAADDATDTKPVSLVITSR